MKKRSVLILCVLSTFLFCTPSLHALKQKTKYFKSKEEASCYLTTHYNLGSKYYNNEQWRKASTEFEKVIFYFPASDEAAEASYYLAVSYFEMKEYDFANEEFSNYLKTSQHPAFFEDAVAYKFCIAEHFKRGKKRHPFKMRYLPKWISAQDSALEIYDEVVAALPNHELAVQALYSKADLQRRMREYRDCVETYQIIIRRFPKNEIVPACYLHIADAYIQQASLEFQNPDILALAELNVRKFKDDFPRDERVVIAEESVYRIKEMYAKGLSDLGSFYERLHKPDAAAIYYQSSIEEFPDTNIAQFCRSRLICLGYTQDEVDACSEETTSEETSIDAAPVEATIPSECETNPECMQVLEAKAAPSWVCQENGEPPIEDQVSVHYSLTKKREMKDSCATRCGPPQETYEIKGAIELPENLNETPQSSEMWHYSVIKNRDQYDACQD